MFFGKGGLLQTLFLPGYANAGADTSYQVVPSLAAEDVEVVVPSMETIQRFAPKVWMVEGPVVSFYGFPYPTRMVVIQLTDGSAWIWSPIALTEELASYIVKIVGPVKYIVSPNYLHWLFLKEWQEKFPEAKVFASPGLAKRKVAQDVNFFADLTSDARFEFSSDIDHIIFEGGVMDEVVFFHKSSRTVIFCDLIQRHFEDDQVGWKGWLMRSDGLVGPMGSTPKEWSFVFWLHGLLPKARLTLNVILEEWKPEGMIIAHGEVAPSGACVIIENSLSWIPKDTSKSCWCCSPKTSHEAT